MLKLTSGSEMRIERINLGKGKWPEDFMDVATVVDQSLPIKTPTLDRDSLCTGRDEQPCSRLSQRMATIVARESTDSVESLRQFYPRRPSHRS